MPSSRTALVTVQEKVTMSSTMLRPVPSPVALMMEQEQVAMSGVPRPMNSLLDQVTTTTSLSLVTVQRLPMQN